MTIKDIARESGYAVSTVSRALNNHPDVSETAREKIQQVVARLNFEPNHNARELKQQQSSNIAIIIKGYFNMFFASVVEPIQNEINAAGYNAVVHYIAEDADEILVAERICRERKPLGIIFLGGNINAFQKRFSKITLPCVISTTLARDLSFGNLSSVGVDDVAEGRKAVNYLFEKGHQNIGIIGGDRESSYVSKLRYDGCRMAFEEHHQECGENDYQKANFSFSSSYRAMKKLISRKKGMTAVFCMSDIMAVGAMRAAADAGLRVPEDISVIGFDGLEFGRYCNPRLTTFLQPRDKIAEETVNLIIANIEKNEAPREMVLGAELVEGESVRRF